MKVKAIKLLLRQFFSTRYRLQIINCTNL